jgi:mono/diheme cytochrome c family protein
MKVIPYIPALSFAGLLAACGNYSLPVEVPTTGGGNSGGTVATKNCDELFTLRVQPRLDFCRNCHVPGGVADVPDGRLFLLSTDESKDFDNLRAAWENLGRNDSGKSRILKMASGTDDRSHSGGTPWPVGSDAYKEMDAQLLGFVTPQACLLSGLGGTTTELPLLGSKHGGHAWFDFCEGKPDSATLPPDPRSLVKPGVNRDKSVYFNAYWKDCHADPVLVGEEAPAKTCGELREFAARGEQLIKGNGAVGAGAYFAGDGATGGIVASDYNNLWQKWGLTARPDNFDQLVAERYGMSIGAERNPYPLPGEDPNQTDGGSGQLPTGLTQQRTDVGAYAGTLGTTCHVCHSGQAGSPQDAPGLGALYGNGNSLSEYGQISQDLGAPLPGLSQPYPIVVGKTRGTNNALALQIITFVLSQDLRPADPDFLGFALLAPNGGSIDAPAWWNVGHRPVKFQDGFLAMDALRSDLGFFLPGPGPGGFDWIKAHDRAGDTYLMSLKSPAYPAPIDAVLATQGAILFHSKDLWAENLHNPVPKPGGGNGSCAGCHGAYAPRYVNDPAFLDTPALEGIASYIVPRDLIGTDPARVDSDTEAAEQYGKENFFAYPETLNPAPELDCSTQNRAELRGDRVPGYLAPPLYGVWASAPYLHNGSVPNVWEVLKSADRQPIWRRVSTPARPDQAGSVVMGYDIDLERAYDKDRLGWKYEVMECGVTGTTPYLDCDPGDQAADPPLQTFLAMLLGNDPYLWYLGVTPLTDQQLEDRKIYNTHMYSQSAAGHEFTAVLTDPERRALIEYLKTL